MQATACLFSSVFILASLQANSWLSYWLFLEMSQLCLVPLFLNYSVYNNYYKSLTYFLLVSVVSSNIFIFFSVLPGYNNMILTAFFLKFGCFPFCLWVFNIITSLSWLPITFFCVISKLVVIYLLNINFSSLLPLCNFYIPVTLIFLSGLLVSVVYNFKGFYAIITIGSSCVLLVMLLSNNFFSFGAYNFLFCFSNLAILIWFSNLESFLSSNNMIFYIIFVITLPVSLGFLYKLITLYNLFNLSCGLIFLSWFFYSALEQICLIKYSIYSSISFITNLSL